MVVAPVEGGRVMDSIALPIAGAYVLESRVWGDDRGFFREWFRPEALADHGIDFRVAQTNLSSSVRNVVRGLHYSMSRDGQAKLVTCAAGSVVDVLVDVREGSPTFGEVALVELAGDIGRSVYLPGGVAHGFCATSDVAVLTYLLSSPYDPAVEFEINPLDPAISVPWPLSAEAVLSDKDRDAPSLAERRAAGQIPTFS